MSLHPLAGKPAPREILVDCARLERDYYDLKPDPFEERQQLGQSRLNRYSELHDMRSYIPMPAVTQLIERKLLAHRLQKKFLSIRIVLPDRLQIDVFQIRIPEVGGGLPEVFSIEELGIEHQTVHVENDGMDTAA